MSGWIAAYLSGRKARQIHITGKWTNVCLTNNLFRNAIYKDEWWAGRVIYYNAPADTLVEINNALENVGFGLIQLQGNRAELLFLRS